jgi:hypothetical protein
MGPPDRWYTTQWGFWVGKFAVRLPSRDSKIAPTADLVSFCDRPRWLHGTYPNRPSFLISFWVSASFRILNRNDRGASDFEAHSRWKNSSRLRASSFFLFSLIFNNPLSFHQHRGRMRVTRFFSSTSWKGEMWTFFLHVFSTT